MQQLFHGHVCKVGGVHVRAQQLDQVAHVSIELPGLLAKLVVLRLGVGRRARDVGPGHEGQARLQNSLVCLGRLGCIRAEAHIVALQSDHHARRVAKPHLIAHHEITGHALHRVLGHCLHELRLILDLLLSQRRGAQALHLIQQRTICGLIVGAKVVGVIHHISDLLVAHASRHGLSEDLRRHHVVLVGQRHDRVIHGIVGLEEGVGKPLRRDAAGILGFLRLAAVHAVHLGTLDRLHGGYGQVCVEAAPQQRLLGVRIPKMVRVERQPPRRQAGQLFNPPNRVLNGPHGRLEILDGGQGLPHQLDGLHGAAIGILGCKVPGPAGCKVSAWAGSEDGVDVLTFKRAIQVVEELGRKLVDITHLWVFLDVKAEHLIPGFLPRLAPLAGHVKQRQDDLFRVAPCVALRLGVTLPFLNTLLGLLNSQVARVLDKDARLLLDAHNVRLFGRVKHSRDGICVLSLFGALERISNIRHFLV